MKKGTYVNYRLLPNQKKAEAERAMARLDRREAEGEARRARLARRSEELADEFKLIMVDADFYRLFFAPSGRIHKRLRPTNEVLEKYRIVKGLLLNFAAHEGVETHGRTLRQVVDELEKVRKKHEQERHILTPRELVGFVNKRACGLTAAEEESVRELKEFGIDVDPRTHFDIEATAKKDGELIERIKRMRAVGHEEAGKRSNNVLDRASLIMQLEREAGGPFTKEKRNALFDESVEDLRLRLARAREKKPGQQNGQA